MYQKKYTFIPAKVTDSSSKNDSDVIAVEIQKLYSPETGYGFVTEKNYREQQLLQIPELNSAFIPLPWYQGSDSSAVREDLRQIPLCFKCDVPTSGNYRVKITILPEEPMQDIRIFTGRRRLAVQHPHLAAGEKLCEEVIVNVCDIIPRGHEEVFQDRSIDLTVTADHPCISEVEVTSIECPTLYICGDSTVTDQSADYPYAPETCYAGWGQMMPLMLNSGVSVSNHSHSGLTTESFRSEGHMRL